MPRVRIRTTNRGVPAELLERASKVVEEGRSIRSVAEEIHIPVATLTRYVKRKQELAELCCTFYIFFRKLAFELASFHGLSCPVEWANNGMAGESWFTNFMRRHQNLSVRRPQATSLTRSTSFNEKNVEIFNNLATVYRRYGFEAKDIWNVDETSLMTVQKPGLLVSTKGERRVSSGISAERGALITMALAGNALGNIIPSHFVFLRNKFLTHFIRGGSES
uniref:HTH psq-type domain-containing protein n=1 Tax=Sinocyclocheilus grahami TaxID=75366 RepID=A0A672K5C4_SINGR